MTDTIDAAVGATLHVPHVVKGRTIEGRDTTYLSRDVGQSFATPMLDLDDLVWPRAERPPAADLPISEIVNFLVELGDRLRLDRNPLLQEALERMTGVSTLGRRILTHCYEDLHYTFARDKLVAEVEQSYGSAEVIDGWQTNVHAGSTARLRAYPMRLVHLLAGNAPNVAALTVMRGALSKGVNLLKMASNDLFTPTAILRTMAEIDATHPLTRSFSAVYWKGGDRAVESTIFRPQYFDKIVAWGGESAIRHAVQYVGPGFELIAFDPKVSASLAGREALRDDATIDDVARRAAADTTLFNQDVCAAARYLFVEGDTEEVDRLCERIAAHMGNDTHYGDGQGHPTSPEIRDAVEGLKDLEPFYAVFGGYDGRGLVVRSDEPVDFHPDGKTLNVVQVPSLDDALRHITVATQTIGVWPPERKMQLADGLSAAGAQRIVTLGEVASQDSFGGRPHDGTFPLHRYVRWVTLEGSG